VGTSELLTGTAGSLLLAGSPLPALLSSTADAPEATAHVARQPAWGAIFAAAQTLGGLGAAAGNNLAALVLHQSQAITSVADNLGGAWALAADMATGVEGRVGIWYRLNVPAGVTSVTVTPAASTALITTVVEFTGAVSLRGATAGTYGSTSNPAAVTVAGAPAGSLALSVAGYFNAARSEVLPADYERLGHPGLAIATTQWAGSYKELAAAEAAAGPDYGATATLTNFGTVTAVFGP
jgi:hypothetical protein